MSKPWPRIKFGDVLRQRAPDVKVDVAKSYQFAGVYCFGRGVFRGQERMGNQFAYQRLSKLRAGDFVYPKLMAWEGAFGVVPAACDGCGGAGGEEKFQPTRHLKSAMGEITMETKRGSEADPQINADHDRQIEKLKPVQTAATPRACSTTRIVEIAILNFSFLNITEESRSPPEKEARMSPAEGRDGKRFSLCALCFHEVLRRCAAPLHDRPARLGRE